MRKSDISRETNETSIQVTVDLDGSGDADIKCPSMFMQHMLTSLTVHSGLDVKLVAEGDLQHHIIEDIALCLGRAVRDCIGDPSEITRFGHAIIPMDCSVAMVAVDLCNRPYSVVDLASSNRMIEDTQTEDILHFFTTFATSIGATVHVKVFYGENDHHKVEAAFKALAHALRTALQPRAAQSPPVSSKGVL